MNTWPLKSLTVEQAMEKQFRLIDEITKVFPGDEIMTRGDLGVVKGLNQPRTTNKVEAVLANYFHAEAAMLVRGSGTMAIRLGLHSFMENGARLLIHRAPVYPTTTASLKMLGIQTVEADFNHLEDVKKVLSEEKVDGALVQLSRQKMDDRYDAEEVIRCMKEARPDLPVLTDDNYAVLKIPKCGWEMGADLSSFSTFKLLGPEGIGCIVGKKSYIDKLRQENYSGGLQVQGHEALDVLRGMIYAPVSLAISAQVSEEVADRLNTGEVAGVKEAFIANAQSKVILVRLEEEIASSVLEHAEDLGAAPIPVGSESQYEFVPMFYRISGTFRATDPEAEKTMVRINPMRSGPDTILRILDEAIKKATNEG
ncbi:aminotransferase class V-fold PLP-dependent enzyme [Atopococcus tabaci]|uniref:aminotransferase class V-fold PLP-dependent enzyme n=1 Tax=Atopococcus tabaci TaxID=269774 RepID=UPI002409E337|nr:aminotransferase class V-fold PLP-dependent enzyme [Atopococcus tabaci]